MTEPKMVSECHGWEAIPVYSSVTHFGITHLTRLKGYRCDKCKQACLAVEAKESPPEEVKE